MHSFPLAGVDVHEGVGRQAWVGGLARRSVARGCGSVTRECFLLGPWRSGGRLPFTDDPSGGRVTSLALGVMVMLVISNEGAQSSN